MSHTVTLEMLDVLLLLLFAAVAGAGILVLAVLGAAGALGAVLGRAIERAAVPSVLDKVQGDPAREAEIERNFRLDGGYGAPGRAPDTVTLSPSRPAAVRAPCGPCARLRGLIKKFARFSH